MLKKCSREPEELHAFSIRILYQNVKYLITTPSKVERTHSKKEIDEINVDIRGSYGLQDSIFTLAPRDISPVAINYQ